MKRYCVRAKICQACLCLCGVRGGREGSIERIYCPPPVVKLRKCKDREDLNAANSSFEKVTASKFSGAAVVSFLVPSTVSKRYKR